jgi:hypothetical protein
MTASERKALKKAKQKEKKTKEDDLDQALAELSIQYVVVSLPLIYNSSDVRLPQQEGSSQGNSKGQTLEDFLGVSLQYLDAKAELRKFFGSRVVQATQTKSSTPPRRNAGTLRSNLTRPQSSWWSATQREGLSIRPLTDEEVKLKLKRRNWAAAADEKWWTVEYSKKYKSVTRAFMRIVQSGGEVFYSLALDVHLYISQIRKHYLTFSECYRGTLTRSSRFPKYTVTEKASVASFLGFLPLILY